MSRPNAARALLFAAVFSISFAIDLRTLAPTVALNDSGALTLATWCLGNAHPPGMPLYVMATHLVQRLPFGSVIWRTNLSSAFFASLACGFLSLVVLELLAGLRVETTKRRKGREKTAPQGTDSIFTAEFSIAAAAGLLLAFGRTLWGYATVAEVYALNAAFITVILWVVVRWRAERHGGHALHLLAFLGGLALGVHYVTIAFVLLAALVLIARTEGWRFFRTRQAMIAAAIALGTAAIVYAYLPLAAARDPVLNWGDPDSVDRFIGHVTARQFRVFVGDTASGQGARTTRYFVSEFGTVAAPVFMVIAAWGLVQLFRRDRSVFWMLLTMAITCLVWLNVYEIIYDADAYLLPAHIAMAIAFAIGAAAIASGNRAVAAMFLIVPAIALMMNWKWRDRSEYRVADQFVKNTLAAVKGDSLLLTENWQLYSPLLYSLEVEKERPDVRAVLNLMLFWPWYLDSIERRYPDVTAPIRSTIAEFRPQSIRYERDLQWRRAGGDARLLETFDRVVFGMIDVQLDRGGRVYITPGILLSQDAVYRGFLARLLTTYEVVPQGMVVEIAQRGQNRAPELTPIDLRGLTDGSLHVDPDDAVVREIIPAYSKAFHLRGRSLAIARRYAESLAAYRQALALTPANTTLQQEMRRVEGMAGR